MVDGKYVGKYQQLIGEFLVLKNNNCINKSTFVTTRKIQKEKYRRELTKKLILQQNKIVTTNDSNKKYMLTEIMTKQLILGDTSFQKGHLHIRWVQVQQELNIIYKEHKIHNKTMDTIIVKEIKQHLLQKWKLHNEYLHNTTTK